MNTENDVLIDIAEQQNIVNVLISNFATQCLAIGAATTEEEVDEHRIGLRIASGQLSGFIADLIAENGNLKLP